MPYSNQHLKRSLYPRIEPFAARHIDVGDGHEIYVEQSGNRRGYPIVFVHGGPGGGTASIQRQFFNPERFHIILFDQRGCGKSRPNASLTANTTWDLIADMERIRIDLGVKRWVLFGGSWGSTLSLLYAQSHPERVKAMILRGIFLMRQQELDWFYGHGTKMIFPEAWEKFVSVIPTNERSDIIGAYYRRLTSSNKAVQIEAAKHWSAWEGNSVTLVPSPTHHTQAEAMPFALAFARIEAHYFVNGGFLKSDNQILENCDKVAHIPTQIIQGRYDAICPPGSAWELSKTLDKAQLTLVPVAGHSAFEADIIHELVLATDTVDL